MERTDKLGKSAPEAPDPYATAQAQAQFNNQTAQTQQALNMVNQVTPYGTLTYEQTGQQFTPGAGGQTYYYNPSTGEYSSTMPLASGGTSAPSQNPNMSPSMAQSIASKSGESGGGLASGWQMVQGTLVPKYTATTQFSPSQQAIFDQSQAAMGNLAQLAQQQSSSLISHLGQPMDLSGAPALQSNLGSDYKTSLGSDYTTQLGPDYNSSLGDNFKGNVDLATSYAGADDFSADRAKYEDALWQRGASDRSAQEAQLRTTLANKGIREGSAAWNAEMERLGRQTTDAQLATYLAGGQEQSRMVELARQAAQFGNDATLAGANFGNNAALQQAALRNDVAMNSALFGNNAALQGAQFGNNAALQQAQFGNQARSQYMDEAYAQRNQPINELTSLLGLSQVQNPTSANVQTPQASVGGVDFMGLAADNYKNQSDNYQEMMGGMFDLATAGMKLLPISDERAKEDIHRVGETDEGTPIYTYRLKGGAGPIMMGVLAQEVDEEAREMGPDGLYRVDYGRVR